MPDSSSKAERQACISRLSHRGSEFRAWSSGLRFWNAATCAETSACVASLHGSLRALAASPPYMAAPPLSMRIRTNPSLFLRPLHVSRTSSRPALSPHATNTPLSILLDTCLNCRVFLTLVTNLFVSPDAGSPETLGKHPAKKIAAPEVRRVHLRGDLTNLLLCSPPPRLLRGDLVTPLFSNSKLRPAADTSLVNGLQQDIVS